MPQSEKKVVVCVFPFAFPGSGKSFFFNQLVKHLESQSDGKVSCSRVSSDEIRGRMVQQVMAEKGVDKDRAF